MDRDERQNDRVLALDKDAQINVVVNNSDSAGEIDLGRVFYNAKKIRRVYAWVLLLCVVACVCASLLVYQLTADPTIVSSVVTLKYEVPNPELDPKKNPEYDASMLLDKSIPKYTMVADLSAPDGTDLDLGQITSSYVLNTALNGLELSHPVTLTNLRSNIRIEKILTEESRRQQELLVSLMQDKSNALDYTQMQEIELTYDNQFIVSLSNGFGDEDSRIKYNLTDDELRTILDRILDAYNSYLARTYADNKLPGDEIAVINTENLDTLESLDLLRSAVDNLYNYCDSKPDSVKSYRSWRTGRSLNDLMENLDRARNINVDYLYAYVCADNIVRDRGSMITNYRYQLRGAQSELEAINKNIDATQTILDNYKNDEVYIASIQETETVKSTQTTSNYYNDLMLMQSENYASAARLEATITELQDKIASLSAGAETADAELVSQELDNAIDVCHSAYVQIRRQMEEILSSTFFTTYANHSVSQGETVNFIVGSMKLLILGILAGLVIGFGLWFLAALAPEFRIEEQEGPERKEADEQ